MDAATLAGRMQGWSPFDSSPERQPEGDASSPTMQNPRSDRMSPVKMMNGSPVRDVKMPIGPPTTSPNGHHNTNMHPNGRMGQRSSLPGPPLMSPGMFGLDQGIGGPPLVNPGPGQFGHSISPFDNQLG
jgi:hypothetical protein